MKKIMLSILLLSISSANLFAAGSQWVLKSSLTKTAAVDCQTDESFLKESNRLSGVSYPEFLRKKNSEECSNNKPVDFCEQAGNGIVDADRQLVVEENFNRRVKRGLALIGGTAAALWIISGVCYVINSADSDNN